MLEWNPLCHLCYYILCIKNKICSKINKFYMQKKVSAETIIHSYKQNTFAFLYFALFFSCSSHLLMGTGAEQSQYVLSLLHWEYCSALVLKDDIKLTSIYDNQPLSWFLGLQQILFLNFPVSPWSHKHSINLFLNEAMALKMLNSAFSIKLCACTAWLWKYRKSLWSNLNPICVSYMATDHLKRCELMGKRRKAAIWGIHTDFPYLIH